MEWKISFIGPWSPWSLLFASLLSSAHIYLIMETLIFAFPCYDLACSFCLTCPVCGDQSRHMVWAARILYCLCLSLESKSDSQYSNRNKMLLQLQTWLLSYGSVYIIAYRKEWRLIQVLMEEMLQMLHEKILHNWYFLPPIWPNANTWWPSSHF